MGMLKSTIILLMILCLSGCRSVNTQIICAQLETHKINPIKSCDVSFKFNRCRCRCFDFNTWERLDWKKCGVEEEGSEPISYPIESCEGISGFFLDEAAVEIRPNIKAMSRLKDNLCQ
jgi:hypothetical protein